MLSHDSLASSEGPDLFDVTIRDGGYVNGHTWTTGQAESVVRAVAAAGIPYTEIGYLRDPFDDAVRVSACCPPDYLERLAGTAGATSPVVMVRPGEVGLDRLRSLPEHGVAMVRVLVPRSDPAAADPYVATAAEAGLRVCVNLTHVSRISPADIGARVARCAAGGANIVYLADSNGSLYPEDVRARVSAAVGESPVPIGFHPHDNLGLAFSNTRAAIDAGARVVDGSLGGIGKGGGNLRLELITAHCVRTYGAKYLLDPLTGDRTTYPCRLRMFADGDSWTLLTGLLDIGLDEQRQLSEDVARFGYDALLRGAGPA